MALLDENGARSADAGPPKRRFRREIASEIRVRFTQSESEMLARLQQDMDLPYAQLVRMLVRNEFRRTYGPAPRPFRALGVDET